MPRSFSPFLSTIAGLFCRLSDTYAFTSRTHGHIPTKTYEVDDVLSDVIREDVAVFIDRLDKARAQMFERERRRMIARRMLWDAPPHRMTVMHLAHEYAMGLRIRNNPHLPPIDDELRPYSEQPPPKDFDFTPFERGNKNMVNVLSGFLSKSESVFCEAVDVFDAVVQRGDRDPSLFGLLGTLSGSHAFDKGDTRKIGWIDSQRRDVMARIDWRKMYGTQPGPLPELDSKESPGLQAAEFAAGIARNLWDNTNTLVALFNTFDYVTYNGKRLSETDAIKYTACIMKRQQGH